MKKPIFLFDLDGVLIKTRYFTVKYSEDFGVSADLLYEFLKENLIFAQTGKQDLKDILIPQLETFHWKGTVEDFIDYWFQYDNIIDTELLAEIRTLRKQGFTCILATNQEAYRFDYVCHDLGLRSEFDALFSSHLIGYSKSDSRYFEHIIETLGQDVGDMVFFDDKKVFIESARSIGIPSIVYTNIEDFYSFCRKEKLL